MRIFFSGTGYIIEDNKTNAKMKCIGTSIDELTVSLAIGSSNFKKNHRNTAIACEQPHQ